MIYICNGLTHICKVPSAKCKQACKCFDGMGNTLDRFLNTIKPYMSPVCDSPLGMFVLGTWAVQGFVFICLIYAASGISNECALDEEKSYAQAFVGVMFLFVFIHCAFALFIQRKFVREIEKADDNRQISEIAWEILKTDVPSCLYIFFSIAAFFFAIEGWESASANRCSHTEYVDGTLSTTSAVKTGFGAVAALSILYIMLLPFYAACFVCGKITSDTVYTAKKQAHEAKASTTDVITIGCKSVVPAGPADTATTLPEETVATETAVTEP